MSPQREGAIKKPTTKFELQKPAYRTNMTTRGQTQKCPEAWKRKKCSWYSPLCKFSRNTVEKIVLNYRVFLSLDQCQYRSTAVFRAFNEAVE